MKTDTDEIKRINEYYMGLLAKNCGMSYVQLQKLFSNQRRELYLDAKQSVKFGIADEIGIPNVEKHAQFQLEFNRPALGKKKK